MNKLMQLLSKAPEKKLFALAFIIVLSAMLALTGLKTNLDADRGSVLVDMAVSVSGTANMWVNDQTQPPMSVKLAPSMRKVYEFSGVTENIRYLRLDPAEGINGATIQIYSVEIQSPAGGKQRLEPKELAKWQAFYGKRVALTDNYIEYVSQQNIILTTDAKYRLEQNFPAFIHSVADVVFNLNRFNIIMGLYIVFLVFASMWSRSWAHAGIVSAVLTCLISLSQRVAMVNFGSISVAKAVGLAAFAGHPLTPNFMFIALSTVSAGIAAGAAYFMTRSHLPVVHEKTAYQLHPRWWQTGMVFILTAAFLFPDLLHSASRNALLWNGMYVPLWDSDLVVTWAYMIKKGMLPFRDFWYPYAGSFAFDSIPPWGDLFLYVVLLGLIVAFFSFISIISRSAYIVGGILVFAILLGGIPIQNVIIFPQPERHLFPFVICFAYIAASGSDTGRKKTIWPFWLATCVGLVVEPSQVVYATLGVGLVLFFDIFDAPPFQLRSLLKRLVHDFAVPAVFLCIVLLVLAQAGVLQNTKDFYIEMGSVSNYMAIPTGLNLSIENFTGLSFFLVAAPFIFFSLGIYERSLARNTNDLLSKAIMAVGAIGIMQLQKHVVRPIDWALFYSSAIGIVLYSVQLNRRMGEKGALVFGSMAGLSAAVFLNTGLIDQSWQRLVNTGQRVAAVTQVAAMDSSQVAAYRMGQFSPTRLNAFSEEAALLAELKDRVGCIPNFYSLPDAPILYVLAGTTPPYQVNGFNMSPIFEQIKMVEYLRSKKVEYVIIEPSKVYFDGFPYFVRLPVLYNYVVANYVPAFATKRFSVFRLRRPGEPTSLDAWVSIFGATVDLGHLPEYAKPPELPLKNCDSDCDDILKISFNKVVQERLVTVPFVVNGKTLGISFVAVPGKMVYWVNLNRIWFWAARADSASVQLGQNMPEGTSAEIVLAKSRNPEWLY